MDRLVKEQNFEIFFKKYKEIISINELNMNNNSNNNDNNESLQTLCVATKRIFGLAIQQNKEYLNKLKFYETIKPMFLLNNNKCTKLLKEIGWDLLLELFLLYTKDDRISNILYSICNDGSPRELSIMFSEVFTHPLLSIHAISGYYAISMNINNNNDNNDINSVKIPQINKEKQKTLDNMQDFHRNINYYKSQILFIKCIKILFNNNYKLNNKKISILFDQLLPSIMNSFGVVSRELSYIFYIKSQKPKTQQNSIINNNNNDIINSIDSAINNPPSLKRKNSFEQKENDIIKWMTTNKNDYLKYIDNMYDLFKTMIKIINETYNNDNNIDLNVMKIIFKEDTNNDDDSNESKTDINKNMYRDKVWLVRFGLSILHGLYCWSNVPNSDQPNIKNVNFFDKYIANDIKTNILNELTKIGFTLNTMISIHHHILFLETNLENAGPWSLHLNTGSASAPTTPTTSTPNAASVNASMEQITLPPIVEEHSDHKKKHTCKHNHHHHKTTKVTKFVIPETETTDDAPNITNNINNNNDNNDNNDDNNNDDGNVDNNDDTKNDDNDDNDDWDDWNDDDNDINDDEMDEQQQKRTERMQKMVDEIKEYNDYFNNKALSCYYHSMLIKNNIEITDELKENIIDNINLFVQCMTILFQQPMTITSACELGIFIIENGFTNKLLTSAEFHEFGWWNMVQTLTTMMGYNTSGNNKDLSKKLWKFIVKIINTSDLQSRFKCIASVAIQCPVAMVSSLMFTELKNQIFSNWNSNDDNNPFTSPEIVMILNERINKDVNKTSSSQTILSNLDSLNACLNVIRFLLLKDKETNITQIYDDDCPLKNTLIQLKSKIETYTNDDESETKNNNDNDPENEFERFQNSIIKNQFLLTLDLLKRIIDMYKQ